MWRRSQCRFWTGWPGIMAAVVGCLAVPGDVQAQREKPSVRAQGGDAVVEKLSENPVVAGSNQFAFDLYSRLREGPGNLFFSPYSLETALAMTAEGARGETAAQMATTLRFPADPAETRAGFAALIAAVNGDDQKEPRSYKLLTANALWLQNDMAFLPAYLAVVRDHYAAALERVDYKNQTESARQTINAWVAKKTQDKIKDLIQPSILTRDTTLVLTNAIYFKGNWANPFNESATKTDDVFTTADGRKVPVPMMRTHQSLRYHEGDGMQVVALPYTSGDLEMLVLLPQKLDGLPALESSLTSEKLERWSRSLTYGPVDLEFPRFRLTEQFDLAQVLVAMGMPLAFNTDRADFSGMTGRRDQAISNVIHKAYVDVNEKGTEAAAATAVVMMRATAVMPRKPVKIRADHPFLFLIRDTSTQAVLFLGRLAEPKS